MGKAFKVVHGSTLYHGDEASRKLMLSKITQAIRAGTSVDDVAIAALMVPNGSIYMGNVSVTDPRVLKIKFMPTFGGVLNQSVLATTADKVFKLVKGGAYKGSSYSRIDLIKSFIIKANHFAMFAYADRILSLYGSTKYVNRGVEVLQQAMPYQVAITNQNAYADIMSLRTEVANMLNDYIMPATIPALDRLISYCQHIYADDVHDKTQFFFLEPYGFYSHLAFGSANHDVAFQPLSFIGGTVYDFLLFLKGEIETFKRSAFYNEIEPDIEKAFVSPAAWIKVPLYQVAPFYDPLKDNKDFEAVYDVEVIQMLRNGQYVGDFITDDLSLFENINEELEQGRSYWNGNLAIPGLLVRPTASDSSTLNVNTIKPDDLRTETSCKLCYTGQFIKRVINGEDFPTPEDSLHVILTTYFKSRKYSCGNV